MGLVEVKVRARGGVVWLTRTGPIGRYWSPWIHRLQHHREVLAYRRGLRVLTGCVPSAAPARGANATVDAAPTSAASPHRPRASTSGSAASVNPHPASAGAYPDVCTSGRSRRRGGLRRFGEVCAWDGSWMDERHNDDVVGGDAKSDGEGLWICWARGRSAVEGPSRSPPPPLRAPAQNPPTRHPTPHVLTTVSSR